MQGTVHWANSAMEQKITDSEATVTKLHIDNSDLMAKQKEMAAIYKNSGVPTEITTGGGGGMLVTPGPKLAEYIEQVIVDKMLSQASSSKMTSGDNNSIVPKKECKEIIWWRQFKYYFPSCGVNLTHGAKKSLSRKFKESHMVAST